MNNKNNTSKDFLTHIDTRFSITAFIALVAAVLCMVAAFTLPESYGGKNSVPEYLQLVLLALGCLLSFRAPVNKTFYVFVGFLLLFLLLREINYGRTLPCFADPDNPERFKKWKEIPYGWLAHPLVGLYLAAQLAFFICKKLYKTLWELISNTRIPAWETAIVLIAAACAQLTERLVHNDFLEEFFELTFYSALMCLIWRYSRGKYSTCA